MLRGTVLLRVALLAVVAVCLGRGAPLAATEGRVREYFVRAEETVWNYTPQGKQRCQNRDFNEEESIFVSNTDGFIGAKYRKAVYRSYTDASFSRRVARHSTLAHLGLLGDPIYAVVGDTVRITFRNSLAFAVNIRPSSGVAKIQDLDGFGPEPVAPGTTVTYEWRITEQAGPGPNDPASVMWLYRSTVDSKAHTNAGLLGPLVVSRAGSPVSASGRPDVPTEIFNVFFVSNENESPFLEWNYKKYSDLSRGEEIPSEDEDFEESNLMHSINGYIFCNGPAMRTTVGLRARWYVAAVGTEVDLHTPHWHGNVIKYGDVFNDVIELLPATVRTLDMIPDTAGEWLYHCHVHDHLMAGMVTRYTTSGTSNIATNNARVRTYFIAVDEVEWDYTPTGRNLCERRDFNEDEAVFTVNSSDPPRIGSKYKKAIYREYTDSSFSVLKTRSRAEEHLGLLGPVIRAEVGDVIVVHFKNNANFPTSIHPHGVQYLKSSEGAPYNDGTSGADTADDSVAPGSRVTYTWNVPVRAGPSPSQRESSIVWLYHSHKDEIMDVYAGLVGAIVITAKGAANRDGRPKGVDREVFTFFQVFDENMSWYTDDNIMTYIGGAEITDPDDFEESNLMHSINGYMYCNMPSINFKVGERVRWYVMALGNEVDLHTATWHGQTVTMAEQRTDHAFLLPSTMMTADYVPDACGAWEFYCQIHDHIHGGMITKFNVNRSNKLGCKLAQPPVQESAVRTYFIAAEKVEWDYVPSGENKCSMDGTFTEDEEIFVHSAPTRIGSKYAKALYREYTDASFTTPKEHDASLGFLGPTIRAEVGDSIRVTFTNKLDFAVNIRPQGLQFTERAGDAVVAPGGVTTYEWEVPVRSGPADEDPSSIAWKYHSTVDDGAHQNAGLVGAIVIARDGMLDANGKVADVDREAVLSVSIMNENVSPYLEENIATYTTESVDPADPDFEESNLKHSINGLLYCNLEYSASANETMRWYLLSVGSEMDLHGVVWRDYSIMHEGMRSFSTPLIAGQTKTVDMFVDHAGKSEIQCDVYDHLTAGMTSIFQVDP